MYYVRGIYKHACTCIFGSDLFKCIWTQNLIPFICQINYYVMECSFSFKDYAFCIVPNVPFTHREPAFLSHSDTQVWLLHVQQTSRTCSEFQSAFQVFWLINLVTNFSERCYLMALFHLVLFVCLFCLRSHWHSCLAYGFFLRIICLNISQKTKSLKETF